MDTGLAEPRVPALRHRALREVLATGLFDSDGGDFASLEGALAKLSRAGASERLVGDIWEAFSEAYLLTEPTVQAEEVWPISEAPDELLRTLNIGRRDKGCDGIFRRRDGALVAYQSKFRSRREPLTWAELATFVGWSERAELRLILTNSDDVSEDALSRDRLMTVRGADLEPLDASRMDEIRALLKGVRKVRRRLEPLPHQTRAVEDIAAGLSDRDRATALMACGSGKTLVALWSAEALGAAKVLVLLPSLSLVRQTLAAWAREQPWGRAFRFLAVCSDDTVADGDAIEMRQSDLPFPITTEADEVRGFLSSHGDGAVSVVFSTYQSAGRVAAGMPAGCRFDFGVFDEAHRTAGHVDAAFSLALRDERLPIAKRLFMTATRRVHSARVKGKVALIHSMDDDAVYGSVAHELSFRRAADLGIICGCRVLVSVVTRAEVAAAILVGDVVVEGIVSDAAEAAGRIAFARAVEAHGLCRAFTFHRSVRAASAFSGEGPGGAGPFLPPDFRLFHVSGRMRTADRDRVLDRFRKAPRGAVSNARCLTEGVDVPAVDLVAFMARKGSQVDIVQAIGRALRRPAGSGKEFGYVLVPLFLDEAAGEELEAAVERTDFGPVWEVLRALMDQDAALVEVIDGLRAGKRGAGGRGGGLDGLVDVIGPAIPLERLRRAIEVRIVEQLGDPFEGGLARLARFAAREGHARVPAKHAEADGYRLGAWVNARRTYRHKLTDGQRAKLEALPGWTWRAFDERFDEGMRHLLAYAAREGHALVPGKHREGAFPLGSWVNTRRLRRTGMPAEQRARLEAVDGWSWDARVDAFEEAVRRLASYAAREGHSSPPALHVEDGFRLGRWVSKRRTAREAMQGEQRARLEAMPGWRWDARDEAFEDGMRRLEAFVGREGHACPLAAHVVGRVALGAWVVARRGERDDMPEDRRARLEALPGWSWNTFADRFDEGVRHLEAFVKREKHAMVPSSHEENGFRLGRWVVQRRAGRDAMPAGRRAVLEAFPAWVWNTREAGFEEGLRRLSSYAARTGHALVPAKHIEGDGFLLGQWVSVRRKLKDRMTQDQRDRLEAVPGWSWRAPGR